MEETPAGQYGYDAFNRLTSTGVGDVLTHFQYDPAGRLYQAGTSSRFLYDGVQAIGEYHASGQVRKRYVPGLGVDAVLTA
ncbi:hypothetical protein [Brevundimonas sp.]|uniref:hypothetical protein n=1 Tax=Brevundimonas sp. TaxID=1871086 RepID=UPI0035682456